VLRLTPDELSEVAAAIRAVIAARGEPGDEPGSSEREAGPGMPVGVVVRMFPLLPASSDD
jgi:hypothetical protein